MTNKERISRSPQYKKGAFQNTSPTPVMAKDVSYIKVIGESLNRNRTVHPPVILPTRKSDLHQQSTRPSLTWFGHSSYLIRLNGKNILIDPVFSGHASPLPWMVKAFRGSDVYTPEDFPVIDLLVITHNHYDHLDQKTIRRLAPKVRKVVTGLGVAPDIPGIDPTIITELDWWETTSLPDHMQLTALPARHFSGRGLIRNRSLWCSFALHTDNYSIYLGGDSGHDDHFKEIGERFGPFDLAVLECGQYHTSWPFIHMMPEQTAQAAIELKAKKLLPVHWAKFALGLHPWDEPIKRVVKAAAGLHLDLLTPMIGETIWLDEPYVSRSWWTEAR